MCLFSLQSVKIILAFHRAEAAAFSRQEQELFVQFCTAFLEDLVPYLNHCLQLLFRPAQIAQILGMVAFASSGVEVLEGSHSLLLFPATSGSLVDVCTAVRIPSKEGGDNRLGKRSEESSLGLDGLRPMEGSGFPFLHFLPVPLGVPAAQVHKYGGLCCVDEAAIQELLGSVLPEKDTVLSPAEEQGPARERLQLPLDLGLPGPEEEAGPSPAVSAPQAAEKSPLSEDAQPFSGVPATG